MIGWREFLIGLAMYYLARLVIDTLDSILGWESDIGAFALCLVCIFEARRITQQNGDRNR